MHPLILCSDFNVYMSALDTSQKPLRLPGASEALQGLIDGFELRDVLRQANPDLRQNMSRKISLLQHSRIESDVMRQANPDLRQYMSRKISLLQHSRIEFFLVNSSLIDSQQITKN